MHTNSSADHRADPDLMTNPTSPWHFNGAHWFLLLTLLLTLRVGATPSAPEEGLPHLGSSHASAPPPLASEQQIATLLKQSATVLNAAQPQQQAAALAVNQAHRLASQRSERWLSQFGRARVNFGSHSNFKQFYGELALLVPLDESSSRPLTFSQLGIHYYDKQPVANIGLGQRHLMKEWLWGYNAFLDQHLKRGHSRLGVGAELWRDYLKFSGNGYFAVSGWKESKTVEGYQEKAASGFDIRVQGYWPNHPQLGAHLLFENYFGDQVALFDKQREDWQKNPLAATLGVHYTPVPLFTVGVDHKIGRKNKKETRFTLQLNYLLDLPWEYQIDPHKVAASRSLALSRYDWVERNNHLVLQYRQLAPISLTLPPADQLVGFPEEIIPLEATVAARFGFKEINWGTDALTAAGGRIEHLNGTLYQVILPKKPGRYPLTGLAVDQQGNQSTAATTELTVKQPITLTLPPQLYGIPEDELPLEAQVDAHFGFKEIKWDDKALTEAGGAIKSSGAQRYQITLPKELGSYPLTGVAIDKKGNQSSAVTTELVVSDVKLVVPQQLFGTPGGHSSFKVQASALKGIKEILWKGDEFIRDGGKIDDSPAGTDQVWTIDFPNNEKNYSITLVAYDTAGNQSQPKTLELIVKKEVVGLTIQGPTANELPTTWLHGETIPLTATGGDGTYAWTSSNDAVASIQDKGNGQCDVMIQGVGSAKIEVTSAGNTASYSELEAEQPLLKAMDNTPRNYLDSEQYCQKEAGSLPTKEFLDVIFKAKTKEVVATWAQKAFKPNDAQPLAAWVEANADPLSEMKRSSYNFTSGNFSPTTNGDDLLFTICRFNP